MPKHRILHRARHRARHRLWIWWLRLRRNPSYVIIYDDPLTESEEYYGYFSSPDEARRLWKDFTMDYAKDYENVKLCRVVEDWT